MSTSFSRPWITGFILGVTAVLCVSAQTAVPTTTLGVTTFTVSISEGPETFKYAEVVARLTTCVADFRDGSDALKADCMYHLVSPDTSCSTVDSKFMCYVGSGSSRVLIDTANIEFAFVNDEVPNGNPTHRLRRSSYNRWFHIRIQLLPQRCLSGRRGTCCLVWRFLPLRHRRVLLQPDRRARYRIFPRDSVERWRRLPSCHGSHLRYELHHQV